MCLPLTDASSEALKEERAMFGCSKMKILRLAGLLALVILCGCVGGSATSRSGDAVGGAGMDVEVYKAGNATYFEAGPGDTRRLRRRYRNSLATMCSTPVVQCPMGVAIPIASPCYCPTYFGPVWGRAH